MATIELIRKCLEQCQTIAVVGLSDKPHRPSYFVGKYLLDHGYTMIPVNPTKSEILGQTCYPSISDVPVPIDMVDCFRKSDQMPELAKDAVAIGARCLWMQLSVVNEEAYKTATDAGLDVVMDRCAKIEHARLFGGLNWAGVNTGIISSKRPRKVNL